MSNDCDLPISLNPHLCRLLEQLPPLLPANLRDQLTPCLSRAQKQIQHDKGYPQPTVPYALLLALSRWSRIPNALPPPLDPAQYSMLNLLAGSTTSPNTKFPPLAPPQGAQERNRKREERRAIIALVNAVVSIVGSGVAGWWVSAPKGWSVELASGPFSALVLL
jgi:hypothetical protein